MYPLWSIYVYVYAYASNFWPKLPLLLILKLDLWALSHLGEELHFQWTLEGTACYAGLLPAPAEGFSLRPKRFLPFGQKKGLFKLFVLILGHLWCLVVTSVTSSSNLYNLENNPKKSEKIPKNPKIKKNKKIQKNLGINQNSEKSLKNPKNSWTVKNGSRIFFQSRKKK